MKPNTNTQDIPIEEVNRVIKESEEKSEEVIEEDGYLDLTEDAVKKELAAKEELDSILVPASDEDTLLKANNNFKQQGQKSINLNLLQFQCEGCNFKSYVNLDDEIVSPMPEYIKCLNCGKKQSIKKRILNTTLNSFTDYKHQEEEPEIDPELKEDEE